MLNRKIYRYLRDFFETEKKALLVTGARQVGKTYAIRKIGNECFKRVVEVNFLIDPKYKTAFSSPSNPKEILLRLYNALSNVMGNGEYAIPKAIVFSNGNLEKEGNILYCPIYMLMFLQPEVMAEPIFKFSPI